MSVKPCWTNYFVKKYQTMANAGTKFTASIWKSLSRPSMTLKVSVFLLCIQLLGRSEAWAKKDPIIMPLGEIGGEHLVTGFQSIDEYRQTFFGMVALWLMREAWAFFKEKTNKTGEKLTDIDNRMTTIETKIDDFIRAAERSEDRVNSRIDRVEDQLGAR